MASNIPPATCIYDGRVVSVREYELLTQIFGESDSDADGHVEVSLVADPGASSVAASAPCTPPRRVATAPPSSPPNIMQTRREKRRNGIHVYSWRYHPYGASDPSSSPSRPIEAKH